MRIDDGLLDSWPCLLSSFLHSVEILLLLLSSIESVVRSTKSLRYSTC